MTIVQKKIVFQSKHLFTKNASECLRQGNISQKNLKMKLEVNTAADGTTVLNKIWTELGKSQFDGKIGNLGVYDSNQLTLLEPFT